jgi:hypothetical protein
MVVFAPTPIATEMLVHDKGNVRQGEDWQRVRERVLGKLTQARETNPREALNELLARLPETSAPLTFCTEMIGILLLNMQRVRAQADGLNPFRVLDSFRTHDTAELESLVGFSVGVTLSDDNEADHSLTQRLLNHVHRYQANLSRLSEESRTALVDFLEEALEALD